MAQARNYPIKRPAGFHWDFFLLGIVTFVSGILGLPAPNGLVPQAPVHTESLSVMKQVSVGSQGSEKKTELGSENEDSSEDGEVRPQPHQIVRTRVVEQRVSHLVMGVCVFFRSSSSQTSLFLF
jgi:hypothetical protein